MKIIVVVKWFLMLAVLVSGVALSQPTITSVVPGSGSGTSQTFAVTANGGPNSIDLLYFLVNDSLSGANACYVQFDNRPSSGYIYLANDDGSGWLGPITPNSSDSPLTNRQCKVTAQSSVSRSGNSLTVNLVLTFYNNPFTGLMGLWAYAADSQWLNSRWVNNNWTWTVPPQGTPSVVSTIPSSGSGSSRTFALTVSDPSGPRGIEVAYLIVNSSLVASNGCYIEFNRQLNTFRLMNDAGSAWSGSITLGSGSLSNSQCTVNGAGGSWSSNGNQVTVQIPLVFSSGFGGVKNTYGYAYDTIWQGSGWMTTGSWTVPVPPVVISGQVGAGATGVAGITMSLSGSQVSTASTDSNGNYSFSVASGGTYVVTPSFTNYTFTPASTNFNNLISNVTGNFSVATEAVSGTFVPQPPPGPAPAPQNVPVVSNSTQDCMDISGSWYGTTGPNAISLYQTGSTVTGSLTLQQPVCGNVTYDISVYNTQPPGNGVFNLVTSNPQPSVDGCGATMINDYIDVQIASCSAASATYTDIGPFLPGTKRPARFQGTYSWARTSSPLSVFVSVDLLQDQVNAELSGQNKSGPFSVQISGTDQTGAIQTTTLVPTTNMGPSTQAYSLKRTILVPAQYSTVTAKWDNTTLLVPVHFTVIGSTRFTQYNVPHESQCQQNQQPAWVGDSADANYCYYTFMNLGATFMQQTITNGTGVTKGNLVIKPWATLAPAMCLPPDSALPDGSNTFFAVDTGGKPITKIRGTCNNVMSDGTGSPEPLLNNNPPAGMVATFPNPADTTNNTWNCSDQLLVIDPTSNTNDSRGLRAAQDQCAQNKCGNPATFNGGVAHIDMFTSNPACTGITDYSNHNWLAVRVNR